MTNVYTVCFKTPYKELEAEHITTNNFIDIITNSYFSYEKPKDMTINGRSGHHSYLILDLDGGYNQTVML